MGSCCALKKSAIDKLVGPWEHGTTRNSLRLAFAKNKKNMLVNRYVIWSNGQKISVTLVQHDHD